MPRANTPHRNTNKVLSPQRSDSKGIGRMFLVSIVLHLLLVVLLGGYLIPKYPPVKKPVYFVDLLHKPVAKPRSGRPDAHTVKKKKKIAKKKVKKIAKKKVSKTVVSKTTLPVKKSTTVVKKIQQVQPSKKIDSVKTVQPENDSNPLEAIEQMRRKQRIAALKQELNDLAHDATPTTVPVGIVGGSGAEAGVDFTSWIKTYLSAAWVLPRHYWQRGLVGKMLIRFDRNGRLIYHELVSSSGDSFFDASIKRAVQQLQQLPSAPQRQLELIITFDPKELLNR